MDTYFRDLQANGTGFAILADDGEKFGGWPGTYRRVWEEGWFEDFADALTALRDGDVLRFVTPQDLVDELGAQALAYPPSASYREMGEWALLPETTNSGHPFKGAPWRNFFLRYAESNALHKKARALSRLCHERGDPQVARLAIGRAQCNDPYWHGVFGGIYMKHLRDAAWRQLALAESSLRAGEGLQVERTDLDLDGEDELWIHSDAFSAQVGVRSGRIKELTRFAPRTNLADVLTRRWEAYHGPAVERGRERRMEGEAGAAEAEDGAAPSIHDLEDAYILDEAPVVDWEDRSLVVARIVAADADEDSWARRDATVLWSFEAGAQGGVEDLRDSMADGRAVVSAVRDGVSRELQFSRDGGWKWRTAGTRASTPPTPSSPWSCLWPCPRRSKPNRRGNGGPIRWLPSPGRSEDSNTSHRASPSRWCGLSPSGRASCASPRRGFPDVPRVTARVILGV